MSDSEAANLMHDLYVLGGVQRPQFRDVQEEWRLFEKALIGQVSVSDGGARICREYDSPADARAGDSSSVLFKSGWVEAGRLYVCTSTEVLIFQVPELRQTGYISLPFFNDLHHVRPTPRGTLAVVVTGLDMVSEITREGELVKNWSTIEGQTTPQYSSTVDYRKIPTLKPYRSHPNFAFWAQDELWVSRGDLGDAICLADPERRIHLPTRECIHDGWVRQGRIYFTSVDGRLFVIHENNLKTEAVYDLNTFSAGETTGYSWCRGVLPVDDHLAWVCFTRIRQTRWKEKVQWIKNIVRGFPRPTCIALYDLAAGKVLREINLEPMGMHAVFNAVPVPLAAPPAAAENDHLPAAEPIPI